MSWHLLYKVSSNEAPYQDFVLGSRCLSVWYNSLENFLHVRSYRFGTPNGDDFNMASMDDIFQLPVDRWFFIYHAYSVDTKKSVFYARFDNPNTHMSDEYKNIVQNLV